MARGLKSLSYAKIQESISTYRRAQENYCYNSKPFVTLDDSSKVFSLISPPIDSPIARRRVRSIVQTMRASQQEEPGVLPVECRTPHVMTIAVTYNCQCDCQHCSASTYRQRVADEGGALSTAELKDVIGQAIDMGTTCVIFGGGEPLLFNGLYDVIQSIDRSKCICTIFTNGEFLTDDTVGKLKQAGVFGVYLSVDYPDAARHDAHRNRPGLLAKGTAGLKRCQDAGIPTGISTYATRENIRNGDLAGIMDLGRDLGILEVFLFDVIPTGRLQGQFDCVLTDGDVDLLREFRAHYNQQPRYPLIIHQTMLSSVSYPCIAEGCPAGLVYVHLRANGDVSPCDFCPYSFGNIRQKSFREIWREMVRNDIYRKVSPRCRLASPDYWARLDKVARRT